MESAYSVLMSVYKAENPDYLHESLCSMLEQTLPPKQLVLVCDGPLSDELEAVISLFSEQHPVIDVLRLIDNLGLGQALNAGLSHCRNELVVRMDSDDISCPDRCQKQISFMQEHNLDLCSAAAEEFVGELQLTGQRALPIEHDELVRFARMRNPINHPCVVFRKSMVEKAGGYRHIPFFEDYDLWARMILLGARLGNYPEPLLYMRAGEGLYRRRSGLQYCRHIVRFWKEMHRIGFCSWPGAWVNMILRCAVSLLPTKGVQYLYQQKLHTRGGEQPQ